MITYIFNKMSFNYEQSKECWERAAVIPGMNPKKWRLDYHGNPVCRVLRNCGGPLCYKYDLIVPQS